MEHQILQDSSRKTFESWAAKWSDGIETHPKDDENFYAFACEYYKNGEHLDEKTFVKMCKTYTHTTRRQKRGICQKYYRRLMTIVAFLKWDNKTHRI